MRPGRFCPAFFVFRSDRGMALKVTLVRLRGRQSPTNGFGPGFQVELGWTGGRWRVFGLRPVPNTKGCLLATFLSRAILTKCAKLMLQTKEVRLEIAIVARERAAHRRLPLGHPFAVSGAGCFVQDCEASCGTFGTTPDRERVLILWHVIGAGGRNLGDKTCVQFGL